MTSYRQIYYYFVFNTKNRQRTIPDESSQELYKYIWGIIKNKGCKLYRINGSSEHLHLLCDLHPSIALADFVRDIKISTSEWVKQNKNFPDFAGSGDGYGGFTISHDDRLRVINYIKNQKEHHKREDFIDEYKRLLIEYEVSYDEKYL